jgi:hypothetical protein
MLTTTTANLHIQGAKLSRYADWTHMSRVNTDKTVVTGIMHSNPHSGLVLGWWDTNPQ